jgi:arylsulfatase A-like enzyme
MYSSNVGVENGGCDDISLEAMFPTESMTGLHHLRNICSALNHLDRSVAKIMDHLKSAHQWEDTIFIFTSTNGRSVSSSISSAGFTGSMQTRKVKNDDEYVCLNTQIYCYP